MPSTCCWVVGYCSSGIKELWSMRLWGSGVMECQCILRVAGLWGSNGVMGYECSAVPVQLRGYGVAE